MKIALDYLSLIQRSQNTLQISTLPKRSITNTMAYPVVISAVNAAVADAKKALFADLKNFVMTELDEDSIDAIKELFDKYEEVNAKSFEVPKLPTKGKKSKKTDSDVDESKPAKAKRAPSSYNKVVGEKMKELRAADVYLSAKEAMQKAMLLWKEHKEAVASSESSSSTSSSE